MSDTTEELASQPGKILKAAREELNYTLDYVADELHLRPAVVEAIESDRYSEFDSDVFLKGYFRSYCRLVNLHESRMSELLEKQLKSIQTERDTAEHDRLQIERKIARNRLIKRGVFLLVLAGIVVAVIGVFLPGDEINRPADIDATFPQQDGADIDSNGMPSEQTTDPASGINDPADEEVNSAVADEENPAQTAYPDAEQSGIESDLQQAANSVSGDETKSEVDAETPVENVDVTAPTSPERVVMPATTGEAISGEATEASVKITFTGDCWVQLSDATDKTVVADLKRAGDVVDYSGPSPFELILGDATHASLSYNGQPFDLRPYTAQNGRASFTLNP